MLTRACNGVRSTLCSIRPIRTTVQIKKAFVIAKAFFILNTLTYTSSSNSTGQWSECTASAKIFDVRIRVSKGFDTIL